MASGPSTLTPDHLADGASRLVAALRVARIWPICSLRTPGDPGAASRDRVRLPRGRTTSGRTIGGRRAALVLLALLAASCAARTPAPPPVPTAPSHPEFRYPTLPPGTDANQATRIDRGWQFLQADNLRNAEREFQAALKAQPSFHPAETALGYLELARKDARDAVARFERALASADAYVPALLGRGRALLELGRDGDALTSFETALKVDPSLTDIKSRVELLRVRALQDNLARAKAATDAGRWEEATSAYSQAIAASPDSPFLYRDLALVDRKAGEPALALENLTKAVTLDPGDARSWGQIGAIREEQGDAAGALEAYEKAVAIDPSEVLTDHLARVREAVALAKLPEEYRAIPGTPAATRGDVAAMLGRAPGADARARAPAPGRRHRRARSLGAVVDPGRRPQRRHGHTAELHVPAGGARAPRRPGANGRARPDPDCPRPAGCPGVAGRAAEDRRRQSRAPDLSGGVAGRRGGGDARWPRTAASSCYVR